MPRFLNRLEWAAYGLCLRLTARRKGQPKRVGKWTVTRYDAPGWVMAWNFRLLMRQMNRRGT